MNSQAKTVDEHYRIWTDFLEQAPILDGIAIDEFIVNQPYREWVGKTHPTTQAAV